MGANVSPPKSIPFVINFIRLEGFTDLDLEFNRGGGGGDTGNEGAVADSGRSKMGVFMAKEDGGDVTLRLFRDEHTPEDGLFR